MLVPASTPQCYINTAGAQPTNIIEVMPSMATSSYYARLPALMAPSLTQLTGTVFGGLIHRFQEAINFDAVREHQLVLLYCVLDIEAEQTIFRNAVLRVLETDRSFDKIDWSSAESLLRSKLGAQYMIYNDCIEKVLAGVNALALLTHPDKSEVCK